LAQIRIFQGGAVPREAQQVTPVRAPQFETGAIGEGLQRLGAGISQVGEATDKIADINAQVEANRLSIERDELERQIGRNVRQTLGENADAAAEKGIADLDKGTADILGRASPRAKSLLEPVFAKNNGVAKDNYLDHGFTEKVKAFDTSSQARIDSTLESAADESDEGKALTILSDVKDINHQRASFFGMGKAWEDEENHKAVSGFYKSRALKMTVGAAGSANAAIEYATAHRADMTDADYNAIVSAYNNDAQDELATSLVDGAPLPSATTTTTDDGSRRLDGANFFKAFIAPHEGSAYVEDSNGAGVKYGINATYNPGVDVKGLTLPKATQLFVNNQWKRSGADNLPPALAAVHADTFFLNEKEATRILRESGGDVDKYIALRRQFLNGLVASNPAKYGKYQNGWEQRTKDLEQFAARQGTDGTPVGHALSIGPDTDLQNFRDSVMARTDIGLSLKRKIIERAEARRSDMRQERSIQEDDAQRTLLTTVTSLGDNFTDIKQLPQDAWLRASPAVQQQFTQMAKSNKDNKPLAPDVARDIGFLSTFSPEKLADPKVLAEFGRRGVPASKLNELSQLGGKALGSIAGAKADPIPRSTLESIARPAFESAGYFLWTTESKSDKAKGEERKSEAYRQMQLLNFLSDASQTWAVNNPGKKADDATMRGWVANALRMNAKGLPEGLQNDSEIVIHMNPNDRRAIENQLRSAGLPVTPQNVAEYHRRYLILNGR
jgi:hypothetical protein